jgi:hypothetical protein
MTIRCASGCSGLSSPGCSRSFHPHRVDISPRAHVRFSNRPFGVKRFQTIHHHINLGLRTGNAVQRLLPMNLPSERRTTPAHDSGKSAGESLPRRLSRDAGPRRKRILRAGRRQGIGPRSPWDATIPEHKFGMNRDIIRLTFLCLAVLFLSSCSTVNRTVGEHIADMPPWLGGLPADAPGWREYAAMMRAGDEFPPVQVIRRRSPG